MIKSCDSCGRNYNSNNTITKYRNYSNNEVNYGDTYEGRDICYECAIDDTEALIQTGREYFEAIEINHGELPYDEENRFVP